MKLKRTAALFTALAVAAGAFSACREKDNDSSSSQPDSSVATTTTAAQSAVTTVTDSSSQEDPQLAYRRDKAVSTLSCYNGGEFMPELHSLGGGKLLALTSVYNMDTDSVVSTIQIIDVVSDKVVAETDLLDSMTVSVCNENCIILEDLDASKNIFIDEQLNVLSEFDNHKTVGKFSPDGKTYYFVSGGDLYQMDTGSGEFSKIETDPHLYFAENVQDITPDGKYVFLVCQDMDSEEYREATICVDLADGKLCMLTYDMEYPYFLDDCACLSKRIYDEEDNAHNRLFFLEKEGESAGLEVDDQNKEVTPITGSRYIEMVDYSTSMDEDEYYPPSICLGTFEGNVYRYGVLTCEKPEDTVYTLTYMPQEDLIAFTLARDEDSLIGIIDPQQLSYDQQLKCDPVDPPALFDQSIADEYELSRRDDRPAPQYLSEQRAKADQLEEQFGVKIYISSQCKDMVTDEKGYHCTDEDFDQEYEIDNLDLALSDLETALEKYPDGFTQQFRSFTGNGGLRFFLTGTITDNFSAAYAIKNGEWYDMIIDISYDVETNTAHEMWHSIESFINCNDSQLLDETEWMKLQPEGFEYLGTYDGYENAGGEYCYGYEENWYFYDTYSKVDSFEDKARIMEVVMCPQINDAAGFLKSEHIKAKLKFMCDAVRQAFDTDGWEDVIWEKYN